MSKFLDTESFAPRKKTKFSPSLLSQLTRLTELDLSRQPSLSLQLFSRSPIQHLTITPDHKLSPTFTSHKLGFS